MEEWKWFSGWDYNVREDSAGIYIDQAGSTNMRVLIADDEYLARSSLRSMLEELDLQVDIVGEAANGEELTLLVRQHLPEIAFVDIRMPKLNGLEGIKIGRTASPQTKWYILSGFPEFDYAQEAIRLGVSGYLLKPVNPEDLRKVLSDSIEENRKRRTAQNKQFEREVIALNYGLTSMELIEQDNVLLRSQFRGAIFYLDSHLAENIKAERQFKFCHTIQQLVNQSLDNHNRIALLVLPGGELATIAAWQPVPDYQAERRVWEYFQAVEQEARGSSEDDLAITTLATKECPSYQKLGEQVERLLLLAPLRVLCGIGKKIEITVLIEQADKPGWLELSNLILDICRSYQDSNYLNFLKSLEQFENFLANTNLNESSIHFKAMADFMRRSINCPLTGERSFNDWIETLRRHGEGLLGETPKDEIESPDMIDQIIAFINENYMLDVGLGQIAERFYITPNYLSTLFHKKTGINFMSYLKTMRLRKAKELLADPNVQIQQVAEQVGYLSARHFSRLFSEQFGCLPSEYRDRFKDH